MIDGAEIRTWASRLGVGEEQIIRDHLVSHVIDALADLQADDAPPFVCYGGTALCRTDLLDQRVSEDIDLYTFDWRVLVELLHHELPNRLRREFPGLEWQGEHRRRPVSTDTLRHPDGPGVQIQVVEAQTRWDRWVTQPRTVALRYRDLPEHAALEVPTAETFAAMKLTAWLDRRAPRDLFDLALLAEAGAITTAACTLAHDVTGMRPTAAMFRQVPRSTSATWLTELAHQTRTMPDPTSCLAAVRSALLDANP